MVYFEPGDGDVGVTLLIAILLVVAVVAIAAVML